MTSVPTPSIAKLISALPFWLSILLIPLAIVSAAVGHSSLDSICIDSRVSSIRRRGVVAGAVREKKSGVQVAPTKSVGRVLHVVAS